MPEITGEGRCKGCGSALPRREPGRPGVPRKWCSDNCRKRTWERESAERAVCRDCETALNVSSIRKGNERCRPCSRKRRATEHEALLVLVEWMYNEGRPVKEIAEELGWSNAGPAMDELRKAGRIGYRYKAYELGRAA